MEVRSAIVLSLFLTLLRMQLVGFFSIISILPFPSMISSAPVMKAIVYTEPRQTRLVHDRPMPTIREDTVIVKVVAVALNPTDWQHVAMGMAKEGCLLGVDYAGTVEESNSPEWRRGDRIAGFVHGGNASNIEDGSFADYVVAPLATAMRIPENVSFAEAATLGCGVTTVGQGIFEPDYGLGLNLPPNRTKIPETLLIHGGSSATGSLGIQFAKEYDLSTDND